MTAEIIPFPLKHADSEIKDPLPVNSEFPPSPFFGKSLEDLHAMIETQKRRIKIEKQLAKRFHGVFSFEEGRNLKTGEHLNEAFKAMRQNNSCAIIDQTLWTGSTEIRFHGEGDEFGFPPTYTAYEAKEKIAEIEAYIAHNFSRLEKFVTQVNLLYKIIVDEPSLKKEKK